MKRTIITTLSALCVFFSLHAEVLTHTFVFNPEKFSLTPGQGDSLQIRSLGEAAAHPDVSQPDLPKISRRLAVPYNAGIGEYTVTIYKHLLRTNVAVQNSCAPIPTYIDPATVSVRNTGYAARIYPDSCCGLTSVNRMGGVKVAGFIITPFQYDAAARELYFIDSLTVSLTLTETGRQLAPKRTSPVQMEIMRNMVDNPALLENIPVATSTASEDEMYEYLIITSINLKAAFKPLIDWKQKKGICSKIITTQEITQQYTGISIQEKIKRCIFDQCENYGVQFVLLGGDQWKIPSMPCYVNTVKIGTSGYISTDIPADIYYACPDDYNWDTNDDGRRGDMLNDRINIMPQVYLTRALVGNTTDVTTFVNRIIGYEQAPSSRFWLFQGGTRLERIPGYENYWTGETEANIMFNEVINGKIIMGSDKFFDTYTYNGLPFTRANFEAELAKGYQFAEIICHGAAKGWFKFNGDTLFSLQSARTLNNIGHTLITTTSCNTNAFDSAYTQCLSEVLFNNPNSGVIGYIGSSRYGFHLSNTSDYSLRYEIDFYDRLLNQNRQPQIKNFGALLTLVKHTWCGLAEADGTYRWLHYSINAIGDPETPIFNREPQILTDASVEVVNGQINVHTGYDDARICVSTEGEISATSTYLVNYGNNVQFDVDYGFYDVWITKPGFIPKHFRANKRFIPIGPLVPVDTTLYPILSPRLISAAPSSSFANTKISYVSASPTSNLKVMFTNVDGTQVYRFALDPTKSEETLDLSNLPAGVYVAVLLVDDTPATEGAPIRLIKQ